MNQQTARNRAIKVGDLAAEEKKQDYTKDEYTEGLEIIQNDIENIKIDIHTLGRIIFELADIIDEMRSDNEVE